MVGGCALIYYVHMCEEGEAVRKYPLEKNDGMALSYECMYV